MPELTVVQLSRDQLALAWPLVRTTSPELGPAGWQAAGETLIDCGGGVLGVTASDGLVHGVATYEVVQRSPFGGVLHVGTIATFEFTRRVSPGKYLIEALHALADSLGCSAALISTAHRPR